MSTTICLSFINQEWKNKIIQLTNIEDKEKWQIFTFDKLKE